MTLPPAPLLPRSPALRVAVVGPCASGKSTLTAALRAAGYEARQPAQEHSYVPDMWRRLVDPDVLIYLDISYEALLERRPHFGEQAYLEREKGAATWCLAACSLKNSTLLLLRAIVTLTVSSRNANSEGGRQEVRDDANFVYFTIRVDDFVCHRVARLACSLAVSHSNEALSPVTIAVSWRNYG
jgi:hypothetical protein